MCLSELGELRAIHRFLPFLWCSSSSRSQRYKGAYAHIHKWDLQFHQTSCMPRTVFTFCLKRDWWIQKICPLHFLQACIHLQVSVHLEHCHQAYRSRHRFARLEKCCCAASCRYVVRRYDCLHLSFPMYFISFWGQSMIQFPCQTLEGTKRFALFWLVAKLASGCSRGTCLCATGFPLHTEAVHPDAGLQQQVG